MFKLNFARVSSIPIELFGLKHNTAVRLSDHVAKLSTTLRPLVLPRTSDSSAHTATVRVGEVNRRECGKVPEDSRAGKKEAD